MQFTSKKCKLVLLSKTGILRATKLVKAVIYVWANIIRLFSMESVNLCKFMTVQIFLQISCFPNF